MNGPVIEMRRIGFADGRHVYVPTIKAARRKPPTSEVLWDTPDPVDHLAPVTLASLPLLYLAGAALEWSITKGPEISRRRCKPRDRPLKRRQPPPDPTETGTARDETRAATR